jgi:hypothetical protein
MRAFMSKVRHYDVCPCPINTHLYLGTDGTLGDTCVQQAEREVKRILAETEPSEDRGSVSWPTINSLVYWQRVCARKPQARPLWRDQNAAALALTDALRAFVEEE